MKLFETAQEDSVVGFCNSDITFRLHNTVNFLTRMSADHLRKMPFRTWCFSKI